MALGFVYVLSNPDQPSLLKIGYTSNSVESRAAELSSATGVATAFVVEYWHMTLDADQVERLVHEALAEFRHNQNREFFTIAPDKAIACIESLIRPVIARFRNNQTKSSHTKFNCKRCGFLYIKKNFKHLCPKCGF
jgi:predicted RNA-binding Zn-ribbon protein involved in translation (DUF1610 family)